MRRCWAALGCLFAVFMAMPASPVAAHAAFVGSNLVDGSVLAVAPAIAELHFSEDVLASSSSAMLLHLGAASTTHLAISQGSGLTLLAKLPDLQRGAYILRYVAVDPADLHKTIGSISFGVGVPAPPSESGQQVDSSWLSLAVRVITDSAELLAVGAVIVVVLLVRRGRRDLGDVTSLAVMSSTVVAVGWIGLLAADASTVGFRNADWGGLVLRSDPGRRALVGVQLALGLWWTLRLLRRANGQATRSFVVRILTVIAAGFVIAGAYGGHAAIGGSFIVGVALRVVHVGSLCVWIGTVAATWWLARRDHDVRQLWPSITVLAVFGVAGTGVSGLLMSGRVVVTVTALLGTAYGQRIVMKAGLVIVLGLLGGIAAVRVRRGNAPRHLPVELSVALVAVVVASLLAGAAPARGEQFLPLPVAAPQIVTSDVRDLTVSASIEPARPGPNLLQVRVLETRRPSPGPIENVTVRIETADGSVVAQRAGLPAAGLLEWADLALPNPGTYRVEVDITRPSSPVAPFQASWEVDVQPVPRAHTVLSNRRWAPLAALFAAGWALVVAAAWWATRRRRAVSDLR